MVTSPRTPALAVTAAFLLAVGAHAESPDAGTEPAPATTHEMPPPSSFGEGMNRPVLVRGGSPPLRYSQEWVEKGRDGNFIVRCTLGVDGRCRDCVIVQGIEFMNEETVRWLEQQRFTPVLYRGEPVAVLYVFQLRYVHGSPPSRSGGW